MSNYASDQESVYTSGGAHLFGADADVYLSDPPVARVLFTVVGDHYLGAVSSWDYLCSTFPESKSIPIAPELKAEFDAWDAASDDIAQNFKE